MQAADYLADEELLQQRCCALGRAVGHYCLSDGLDKHPVEDINIIPHAWFPSDVCSMELAER